MIPKWEYKAIRLYCAFNDEAMKVFNKLGEEGWELVTHSQLSSGVDAFLFKRQKQD